jgi:superfamily II DNA/RNA helicase
VFADLGLSEPILRAVEEMGYKHPTPIQEQAIPVVLAGRDVMGVAQTGTGKTAGFTLPMLDILSGTRARARMPRSLILEPTRELALQVAENFVQYGKHLKLTHALIIGGESMADQKEVLTRGVDVLIATPGRLIDMFDRGTILLTDVRVLVIDEADRMLDMGFIPDVERIVSLLPRKRQTLFFSATMGPEIRRLADAFLDDPREIEVARPASVAATITEGLALVAEHDKREALRRLIRKHDVQNALIFCNRKVDVDILYKSLTRHRFSVGALHGDMAQSVRFQTLEKFKANELRLLVCSDVAARGIDIGGLSHVFNFDVPHHAEDYVHRIGRTGRAGLEGHAFTIAKPDDRLAVEAIEKLTGHPIPPLAVDGLDPVDWSAEDGRRRRGRTPAEPARARAPRRADDGDERPRRGRSRPEPARADADAYPADAPQPEAAPPPRGDDQPPARAARPRDDDRRDRAPRGERRDGGRRDGAERGDRRAGTIARRRGAGATINPAADSGATTIWDRPCWASATTSPPSCCCRRAPPRRPTPWTATHDRLDQTARNRPLHLLRLGRPAAPRRRADRRRAGHPRRRPGVLPGEAVPARAHGQPARDVRPRHHERDGGDGLPRRHAARLRLRGRGLRRLRPDLARGGEGGFGLPLRVLGAVVAGHVPDLGVRLGRPEREIPAQATHGRACRLLRPDRARRRVRSRVDAHARAQGGRRVPVERI